MQRWASCSAGDRSLFGDEEQSYEELKKKQDEELDFTGKIQERREREKKERQKRGQNTGMRRVKARGPGGRGRPSRATAS